MCTNLTLVKRPGIELIGESNVTGERERAWRDWGL